MCIRSRWLLIVLGVMGWLDSARADEGMWLLTNPPRELLRQRYGFDPPAEWLEHLQKSCVQIGASGSLVSPDGLLLTNHHVGVDQLFKLSTPERDLLETGFYARTRDQELKCPDLEVRILWSIEDVTARINLAASPEQGPARAHEARRKEMTRVEQESKDKTGLDSQVVTLYHGARYHLYRYKRYDDVRLVMAPEKAVAFFGGDVDNFEYPRFDLDCCFFRIYENNRPIRNEHFLRWSRSGASDEELVFVLGHPGRTQRLFTVEHLKFLRDVDFPSVLRYLWRMEVRLSNFCSRGPENARVGETELFSFQNSRKARTGGYMGLLDPEVFRAKQEMEKKLRAYAATRPAGPGGAEDPWARVSAAEREYRTFYPRYRLLVRSGCFQSQLFRIAQTLVRLADELPKPSPDRLREYRDSELDSVYLELYSPAPIHDKLELEYMEGGLMLFAETFGGDDPLTRTALADMPPDRRAAQLVRGCTLRDVETRKRIAKEGKAAIAASTDPMIRLAAALDPEARAVRKRYEDEVEGVERQAYAQIGLMRFGLFGESVYPDATGTLRFAFGRVAGYEEAGKQVPAFTTFEGMYQRSKERGGRPPFELPERWLQRRGRLDLKTPLNFVLTADIIGGNSGSPVVNRAGELTGLIFDGNLQSLVWDIAYDDRQGRAIAVDARAILEALEKVYDAGPLVEELIGGAAAVREPGKRGGGDGGTEGRGDGGTERQGGKREGVLFDGKTLDGWKVLTEGVYSGHGKVSVQDGAMVLERGGRQTGVVFTGEFPTENYEVSLEGRRVDGTDFFCGLTFPVGSEPCTLILGGWGGSVVGLSNVDGQAAVENQTTEGFNFEDGRWYAIRLRVTKERIQAWIDEKPYIDLEREGHKFSVWFEQEDCRPFGVSTWETTGALRDIRLRRVP